MLLLSLIQLSIIFTNLVLVTALFVRSKNGLLRKAFIAFFLSLMWAKVAWFLAESNVIKIPLGVILIPVSLTSSFLAYHLYVNPYNETK